MPRAISMAQLLQRAVRTRCEPGTMRACEGRDLSCRGGTGRNQRLRQPGSTSLEDLLHYRVNWLFRWRTTGKYMPGRRQSTPMAWDTSKSSILVLASPTNKHYQSDYQCFEGSMSQQGINQATWKAQDDLSQWRTSGQRHLKRLMPGLCTRGTHTVSCPSGGAQTALNGMDSQGLSRPLSPRVSYQGQRRVGSRAEVRVLVCFYD